MLKHLCKNKLPLLVRNPSPVSLIYGCLAGVTIGQQNVVVRRTARSRITPHWAIWKMTVENTQIKSDYALQS